MGAVQFEPSDLAGLRLALLPENYDPDTGEWLDYAFPLAPPLNCPTDLPTRQTEWRLVAGRTSVSDADTVDWNEDRIPSAKGGGFVIVWWGAADREDTGAWWWRHTNRCAVQLGPGEGEVILYLNQPTSPGNPVYRTAIASGLPDPTELHWYEFRVDVDQPVADDRVQLWVDGVRMATTPAAEGPWTTLDASTDDDVGPFRLLSYDPGSGELPGTIGAFYMVAGQPSETEMEQLKNYLDPRVPPPFLGPASISEMRLALLPENYTAGNPGSWPDAVGPATPVVRGPSAAMEGETSVAFASGGFSVSSEGEDQWNADGRMPDAFGVGFTMAGWFKITTPAIGQWLFRHDRRIGIGLSATDEAELFIAQPDGGGGWVNRTVFYDLESFDLTEWHWGKIEVQVDRSSAPDRVRLYLDGYQLDNRTLGPNGDWANEEVRSGSFIRQFFLRENTESTGFSPGEQGTFYIVGRQLTRGEELALRAHRSPV